jgi:hypothetical protein
MRQLRYFIKRLCNVMLSLNTDILKHTIIMLRLTIIMMWLTIVMKR